MVAGDRVVCPRLGPGPKVIGTFLGIVERATEATDAHHCSTCICYYPAGKFLGWERAVIEGTELWFIPGTLRLAREDE